MEPCLVPRQGRASRRGVHVSAPRVPRTMPSEKRPFIFRQIDGTPPDPEELPELLGVDRTVLTTFIERAWELPGEWHRFPGSNLALQALPSEDARRTPRFGIRNAGESSGVHEFRCDLARRIIDSTTNGELEHLHEDLKLSEDFRFGGSPDQFARAVFATIVQRPGIVRPPARPPSISPEAAGNRSTPHEPGFIRLTSSEMMRRIMDHWIGPVAIGWGFPRRFCIASSGSLTFWSFWAGSMMEKTGVRIISKTQGDPLAVIVLGVIVPGVLGFSALYGFFVSWKDQQHGPIRLYLSGLLLSYFVWFLLSQTLDMVPAVADTGTKTPQAPDGASRQ